MEVESFTELNDTLNSGAFLFRFHDYKPRFVSVKLGRSDS
jgi:hypothetical protein